MGTFKVGDKVRHTIWNCNGVVCRVEFIAACYFYIVDFEGIGAKQVSFQSLIKI